MTVSASAVARVVGIETIFKNLRGGRIVLLPQRVAVLGQPTTAAAATAPTTPFSFTTAAEVGTAFGFGSPAHLIALMLRPSIGDGLGDIPSTIYPLADGTTPATGSIEAVGTHVGAASYTVSISGIKSAPFVIPDAALPAAIEPLITSAINAVLEMPVLAVAGVGDESDLTVKWGGTSGNDVVIEVDGPSQGITFTIVQPTGGLVNPSVNGALAQIVNLWETFLVNPMEFDDTTTLDDIEAFGQTRWGALEQKPFVSLSGYTEATPAAGQAIGDARRATDRINGYVTILDSVSLPCQVAARGAMRISRQANDNPPVDYATQILDLVQAGPDESQLNYGQLDASVKDGVSTSKVQNGVARLEDTVTFYHPDGETPPAYRYVVDVVKVQNILFNLALIFNEPGWAGAPLIPDNQPTTNPAARKPRSAVSAVNSMIDSLGLAAIISDPASAKPLTVAVINGSNPKRLDVSLTVQISGNTTIISVDFNFGFFFGTAALIAA